MFDSKKLFQKVSDVAKKAIDVTQQVSNDITKSQIDKTMENAAQGHTMYEVFTPAFGLGIKFIFTENSLIFGNEEYPYTQLSNINIVTPPNQLIDGVAQTVANGKVLNLHFASGQNDRFVKAYTYANEQIDLVNGVTRKYLYILNFDIGTKIEVYEDYIIFYQVKAGIAASINNAFQGGSAGNVLYFSDLTVEIENTDNNTKVFKLTINNGNILLPLTEENEQTAQQVIDYINNKKHEEQTEEQEFTTNNWEHIVGSEQKFTLQGKTLEISAEMDALNRYRLKFRELAIDCSDAAKKEYLKKVQNLATYIEFFPKIYEKYLTVIISKAVDVFISENIWSITKESLSKHHLEKYHLALDEFKVTLDSVDSTSQANQQAMSAITGLIPNLVGGGFGAKGAAKGIAQATAFNILRDGAESSLIKNAGRVNQTQQLELYNRIDHDKLFNLVFVDYWRVFLSVVSALRKNGNQIWFPDSDSVQQAKNIFQNLSNPNFPQDRLLDVFFSILKTNPYDKEYYLFMLQKFGDNEETQAIKNYFGYTSSDDIRTSLSM